MKKQAFNPFLPLNEYIPDGEPHVFGERVYLYGSHDKAGSKRFCVQDYTVWSAPVDDLSDWRCHGVTFRKAQDARATAEKLPDLYAPDCVRGNDGRYYLYYSAMGPNVRPFGPMSVAVGDTPAGPFEYLGDIRNPDGTPLLRYLTNDPAVINDSGRIRLYYGWSINRDFRCGLLAPLYNIVQSRLFGRPAAEIKGTKPSVMGCAYAELEDDMLTVKGEPKLVLDSVTTANRKSALYKHAFYEAASIRKFGELYYLVYSSGKNNELAYATSRYPDRDFVYRGVIVSNADLGLNGGTAPKAPAGTIHGGVERVGDQYYVFYHRCTHNTDFSRQACAEPIEIEPDGTIRQTEITSCGLNGQSLSGNGTYPAAICCNLYGRKAFRLGNRHCAKAPRVFERDGEVFVHDIDDSTVLGYKYFSFCGETMLSLTFRGAAKGSFDVAAAEDGQTLAMISVAPAGEWQTASAAVAFPEGKAPLYLRYRGKGKLDLLNITLAGRYELCSAL